MNLNSRSHHVNHEEHRHHITLTSHRQSTSVVRNVRTTPSNVDTTPARMFR